MEWIVPTMVMMMMVVGMTRRVGVVGGGTGVTCDGRRRRRPN